MKRFLFTCFCTFIFGIGCMQTAFGGIDYTKLPLVKEAEGAKSDNSGGHLDESVRILDKILSNRYYYYIDNFVEYNKAVGDTQEIEDYIKRHIDKNFSTDCYKKEIKNIAGKNQTEVIYTYYIDDKKTNINYHVFIEGDKAKKIILYGTPIYLDESETVTDIPISEEELKNKVAKQSEWTKDGFVATTQFVFYQYRSGRNEKCVAVLSNYQHPKTGYTTSESVRYFPEEGNNSELELEKIERRYLGGKEKNHLTYDYDYNYSKKGWQAKESIRVSQEIAKQDFTTIEKAIRENIDEEFQSDFYSINMTEIHNDGSCRIYYTYIVDGMNTGVNYEVYIDGGKLYTITAYGEPVYPDEKGADVVFPISEEKIKLQALENSKWISKGYRITDQYYFLKTEAETNRPCAVVLSSYESKNESKYFNDTILVSDVFTYYLDGRVN